MAVAPNIFLQTNLLSDQAGKAAAVDTSVVNAWGLATQTTGGGFWIAENGKGVSSVYTGNVNRGALTKSIPDVTVPGASVTGVAFNGTSDFVVTNGSASGPATFVFVTESGQISGWNTNVPAPSPAAAAQSVKTVAGAVYKGVAIGNNGTENLLYAANFATGKVDVFDKNFATKTLVGTFTDSAIPAGYAPFNVANIGGVIFVAYARQDAAKVDEVAGAGRGYISRFDTNGNLLGRFASGGTLNAPWAMVQAPAGFGPFGGDILVGNFGNGRIEAYKPSGGSAPARFDGYLMNASGKPISIDGLWGLAFGNGTAGDVGSLYFAAGPSNETHGLFGKLAPAVDLRLAGVATLVSTPKAINFRTHTFQVELTIRNVSRQNLTGPMMVVLDDLPAGVQITGASGVTSSGKPFITLPASSLAAGGKTKLTVTFNARTRDFGRALSAFATAELVQGQFG